MSAGTFKVISSNEYVEVSVSEAQIEMLLRSLGSKTSKSGQNKGWPLSAIALQAALARTSRKGTNKARKMIAYQSGMNRKYFGRRDSGMVKPLLPSFTKLEGGVRILDFNFPLHHIVNQGIWRSAGVALGARVDLRASPHHPFNQGAPNGAAWKRGKPIFVRYGPKRKMTKGNYVGQMRQPMYKVFGPSPRDYAESGNVVIDSVMKEMDNDFRNNLIGQIKRFGWL